MSMEGLYMTPEEIKKKQEELAAQEKALNERIAKIEEEKKAAESAKEKSLYNGGQAPMAGGQTRSGSLEAKCLASFGVSHPAKLLSVNTAHPKYAHVPHQYKAMARSFKEHVDTARYIGQIFYGDKLDREGTDEKNEYVQSCKNILNSAYGKEVVAPIIKSFGTGANEDWIPTAMSSQFAEEFELEKMVAMAFKEMPMPSNPFDFPIQTSRTVAKLVGENTAQTDDSFDTDKIQFSAKKLGEYYILPEELNEDSAPQILQVARQEVAEAQIRARETAILNGDDSVTHMDFDVTAATDARKLAKGLRKLAIDNSANGSLVDFAGPVVEAKLDEMIRALGRFGVSVRDLVWIFSPTTYHQAAQLANVTTVEKFGPAATILQGALAVYRGIPIMISEYVREDVSDGGLNTDLGDNDKGLVHLVNRRRWMVGVRRPIRVRVMMDLPEHDRWKLASYSRIDFKGFPQGANEISTVLGHNVTVAS